MDLRRSVLLAAVLVLAAAAVGVWAYLALPAGAAIPLALSIGVADKTVALAGLPALAGGSLLILALTSRRRADAPRRPRAWGLAVIGLAALCLVAEAALAASAMAPGFDALRWLVLAGAVLLVLGGYAAQRLTPPPMQGPDAGPAYRQALRTRRTVGRATTIAGVAVAAVVSLSGERALWIAALGAAAATPLLASRVASRLRET